MNSKATSLQAVQTDLPSQTASPDTAEFEQQRAGYMALQQRFKETVQEVERMTQAADALEAEGKQANAEWADMAVAVTADPRKEKAALKRSMECKEEARNLRMGAEVRQELIPKLKVAMAKARFDLQKNADGVNEQAMEALLAELLDSSEFKQHARALYSICEAQCFAAHKAINRPGVALDFAGVNSDAWSKFTVLLARMIKSEDRPAPRLPLSMPKTTKGEIVALSLGALRTLERDDGEIVKNGYAPNRALRQE